MVYLKRHRFDILGLTLIAVKCVSPDLFRKLITSTFTQLTHESITNT
jgi:hypothetical protein